MSKYTRLPPHMKRSRGGYKSSLTPEIAERMRLNAGRISLKDLADLLGVKLTSIRHWAWDLGLKFPVKRHLQAKRVLQAERMLALAEKTRRVA